MDENDGSFYRNVDLELNKTKVEKEEEEIGGGQTLNFAEEKAEEEEKIVIEIPDDDDTTKKDNEEEEEEDEEEEWTLPSITTVLKGKDLEDEVEEIEEELKQKEAAEVGSFQKIKLDGMVTVKETKDGKTMLVFSGNQSDMAKVMADKINQKLERSKKSELCDFKVTGNAIKKQK